MLNYLYFKTTCNIRPRFLDPMGSLKREGPLHTFSLTDCDGNISEFPKINRQILKIQNITFVRTNQCQCRRGLKLYETDVLGEVQKFCEAHRGEIQEGLKNSGRNL